MKSMPKDGRRDVVQKGLEGVCVGVGGGCTLKIVIAKWGVQFSYGLKFFF